MNMTDQDWTYREMYDGESIFGAASYTWSISGVLESAYCFEKIRIPMKLHGALDQVESISENSSENMAVGGWFDPNYGYEYDSLYDDFMANRTAHNFTTYRNMNYKYCYSMFPNEFYENAYIGISVVLFLLMFVGNILVLVLPSISKAFRSPIFTTLLSFSVISLIHGVDMLFYSFAQCSLVFNFRLDSAFECMLFSCGRVFIANVRSLHLCLLAFQRIFLTLFPLKAYVHHTRTNVWRCIFIIYILCILIELIMGVTGLRDCAVDRSNRDWSTIFKTNADFIVLNLMVVSLLLAGILSGIVHKYTSSKLTQSASQRSQSRIASIVIALYVSFYCPLKIVSLFLQFSCADPQYVGPISVAVSLAQFLLNALNPIILCLRVPEAKQAFSDRCCLCIRK